MNNDQLNSVNPHGAVQAAYSAVSALQTFRPAEQIAGAGVLIATICAETGISPSDLLEKAARMAAHADTYYTREIKALRHYVQEELR